MPDPRLPAPRLVLAHLVTHLARLLALLVALLLVVGCDPDTGATPTPSPDPSASPIIQTDAEFCAALDVLESEHRILRDIRLRSTNRRQLDDQFEQLDLAWDELRDVAPRGMSDQIEAMSWAVIDLGLAIEDYTTTDHLGEAADHVLKRDISFDKAMTRLRARTTCAPWAPTPRPQRTATPSPADAPTKTPRRGVTPAPGTSPDGTQVPASPSASTTPRPIGR